MPSDERISGRREWPVVPQAAEIDRNCRESARGLCDS